MGIFGWSYPPGCSGPPDDDDYPCEICGNMPDECECPECPVCAYYGRIECYEKDGHMVMTDEQRIKMEEVKKKWEEQARMESEAEIDSLDIDIYSEKGKI